MEKGCPHRCMTVSGKIKVVLNNIAEAHKIPEDALIKDYKVYIVMRYASFKSTNV